ncbi:hypothetical protein ABT116_21985, partial [Streptomyces sp. NPDC002130]
DWRAVGAGGGRVRLPGYPFRREPYPTPELPRLTRAKTPPEGTRPPAHPAPGPIPPTDVAATAPAAVVTGPLPPSPAPVTAAPAPAPAPRALTAVAGQQLASLEDLVDGAHDLMNAQLRTLSGLVGGDPQ